MSYDVGLVLWSGPQAEAHVFWQNYTSNLAPMWRAAGVDLTEFHGKPASELAPVLKAAIEKIEADPASFAQFNPPNGWGSVNGGLEYLRAIYVACSTHQFAKVEVSW